MSRIDARYTPPARPRWTGAQYVMRLWHPRIPGRPAKAMGFLAEYDPDGRGGKGTIKTTDDLSKAKLFDSAEAIFDEWTKTTTRGPLRRPLQAIMFDMLAVSDAERQAHDETINQPSGDPTG